MANILKAVCLAKAFGSVQAVADVTLDVEQGEILGVLGPNGSGKTTVFNLLTGVYKPDNGSIVFMDRDVTRLPSAKRCRMGMGRTFQIPRPFGNITVLENLLVAGTHGGGMSEKAARAQADEILSITGLDANTHTFARSLRLLDRKRLELARGLATNPTLLLLDEVAGGLTEAEAQNILSIVQSVRDKGVTVVWIEHILMMMAGVDRILVLDQGKTLICGDPNDVMSCKEVLECYLGAEDDP
ncbi:MAG: ABC transporter ATP-binding protein [Desulfarculaceae bacterium]|jgi:branched-chain amino acid transport system ATP-binding protein